MDRLLVPYRSVGRGSSSLLERSFRADFLRLLFTVLVFIADLVRRFNVIYRSITDFVPHRKIGLDAVQQS